MVKNFCFLEISRSCKIYIYLRHKNGSKEDANHKTFLCFDILRKGNSVIAVVRDIGVSREAIFQLKRSDALLPPRMIPKRESGSGAPKKTSPRTDKLLKREVTSYPSITSVEL